MGLNYHIALSGIKAAEALISTAQNNISNAQNTSYARQRVDVNTPGYVLGGGIQAQMGVGTSVDQIQRITNELLIHQSRSELSKVGNYEAVNSVLSSIEVSFNEVGEGSISDYTQRLFNSFEEAYKYPEQSSYRVGILSSANLLADKIQEVSGYLDTAKRQTDTKIEAESYRVNELIEKIGNVNQKIQSVTTDSPNSLLDERDKYLDELSKFIDIDVIEKESLGKMEVRVGNVTIVSGRETTPVDVKLETIGDKWVIGVGDIELTLKSGSVKGLVDSRNNSIDGFIDKLNTFTTTLAEEMNNIHRGGFGLEGSTGLDLFTGTDLRTIKVNEELIANPEKLGLSNEEGVSGNGRIADQLSKLQDVSLIEGKSLQSFYQEFTIDMANNLNNSKENEVIHKNIQSAVEAQRQSTQGINIDDELINMSSYQQFYQANAKSLQVLNEVTEQLFSII